MGRKAQATTTKTVAVAEKEDGLLDQVVAATKPHAKDHQIPDGYELLEGGIERQIRVNRKWLQDYSGTKPVILITGDVEKQYEDVMVLEQCQFQAGKKTQGCGYVRTICLITKSPLAVKS